VRLRPGVNKSGNAHSCTIATDTRFRRTAVRARPALVLWVHSPVKEAPPLADSEGWRVWIDALRSPHLDRVHDR